MRIVFAWLVLSLSALTLCEQNLAVEIVAHRGASFDTPENTVSSMREGWKQQADACELDIRLTQDGQIVLMHDESTKRTARRDAKLEDQVFADLRQLDAGQWKGPQWTGEKIPTLAEALATLPAGKRMFIEIKCGPEVLPELERVLSASGKRPEQLVLIAFNAATLRLARERFPKHPMLWICSYKKDDKTGQFPQIGDLIRQAKAIGANGLDLNEKFPITADFVAKVHAAGLELHVWTVDKADTAQHLVAAGVDGITTNRPGWLRNELGHAAAKKGASR